jgi:hypothetical protein
MIFHCILSHQTQCKHFNQDCSEVCSSLQQQVASVASAASAVAAVAAASATVPLGCSRFCLRREVSRASKKRSKQSKQSLHVEGKSLTVTPVGNYMDCIL